MRSVLRAHAMLLEALLVRPWEEHLVSGIPSAALGDDTDWWRIGTRSIHGVGLSGDENSGSASVVLLTTNDPHEVRPRDLLDAISGGRFDASGVDFQVLRVDAGVACAQRRPALGGDSIGLAGSSTACGTLSCLVRDGSGDDFLLSCNHVLADCNAAAVPPAAPAEIWQFGLNDGGTAGDRIGSLHAYCPLVFGGGPSANTIDAALCRPDRPALNTAAGLRKLGPVAGFNALPGYNLAVRKEGKATGVTQGTLRIQSLGVLINYHGRLALFTGQYGVFGSPAAHFFAAQGDSGALVVDAQNQAVGMVIGIAGVHNLTYVTPIDPIQRYFGVTIV